MHDHIHDHNCDHDHDHDQHPHEPLPKYKMEHTIEDLSPVKKKLSVKVPAEEIDGEYEKALGSLKQSAQLKGFRKGKAPKQVLQQRYGGEVERIVIENLVKGTFERALQENKLQPLTQPQFENLDFKQGKDFTYTATFDIKPEFEVKDYKGLSLKRQKIEVQDKDVDQEMERLREMQGVLKPRLAGATVAEKNYVTLDLLGSLNGQSDDRLKAENQTLQVGAGMIYPEIDQALLGKNEGETFSVKVKLSDNIEDKELAGKEAEFSVNLKAIKQKVLPELNDEFAAGLGGAVKTVLELRQQVRKELTAGAERSADEKLREEMLDQLVKDNQFELPESLVQQEALFLMEKTARRMAANGVKPDTEEFKKPETMERFKQAAQENLRRDLILEKIAAQEAISVVNDDLDKHLQEAANNMGLDLAELNKAYQKPEAREELRFKLKAQKTLDFIVGQAKIS